MWSPTTRTHAPARGEGLVCEELIARDLLGGRVTNTSSLPLCLAEGKNRRQLLHAQFVWCRFAAWRCLGPTGPIYDGLAGGSAHVRAEARSSWKASGRPGWATFPLRLEESKRHNRRWHDEPGLRPHRRPTSARQHADQLRRDIPSADLRAELRASPIPPFIRLRSGSVIGATTLRWQYAAYPAPKDANFAWAG